MLLLRLSAVNLIGVTYRTRRLPCVYVQYVRFGIESHAGINSCCRSRAAVVYVADFEAGQNIQRRRVGPHKNKSCLFVFGNFAYVFLQQTVDCGHIHQCYSGKLIALYAKRAHYYI